MFYTNDEAGFCFLNVQPIAIEIKGNAKKW
jgi:hypothetical protein